MTRTPGYFDHVTFGFLEEYVTKRLADLQSKADAWDRLTEAHPTGEPFELPVANGDPDV